MVYAFLRVKRNTDLLQGVNKLDDLLKVSVFQVYKHKTLQNTDHHKLYESVRGDTDISK